MISTTTWNFRKPRLMKTFSCGNLGGHRRSGQFVPIIEESSSAIDDSNNTWHDPIVPRTKRVQFCDEQNQVHQSPWILLFDHPQYAEADDTKSTTHETTDESHDLNDGIILSQKAVWYHQGDVQRFKHEVQVYARLVLTLEHQQARVSEQTGNRDQKTPWSQSLWMAYKGFQAATSIKEMNEVMVNTREMGPIDPVCVGLEKWAILDLRAAKSRQRQVLVKAVVSRQNAGGDRRLRRVCRELSRPSRLLAIYVGRLVEE
eukprot:scaffold1000_cov166-Amphora_coffeaeformis.AAC.36